MTKVDSLSVVSNTRQLPLVSNPETKANIELFPNDKLKTNVDEVNISSRNSDVNTEEKNDKKRKWLIAAGVAVGVVAVGAIGYGLLKKYGPKLVEKCNDYLIREASIARSPAGNPKLLEAIDPDNYKRISLLKGLSPDEIKLLQESAFCDAPVFFPTLTGHKSACILGNGQDLGFLTKLKDNPAWSDKLDILHLADNNNTYVLNKEKVLEVITRNKDLYAARMGLSKNSSIEDIYDYMIQHKDEIFNCTKNGNYQDIVGMTLGFPKKSSILFQLEKLASVKDAYLLREKPSQYRKVLMEALNNNKDLYANLSPSEYDEIVQAIKKYKPVKIKTQSNDYYQYVKLVNEPEEFARIDQSVADFIDTFSVEKLF